MLATGQVSLTPAWNWASCLALMGKSPVCHWVGSRPRLLRCVVGSRGRSSGVAVVLQQSAYGHGVEVLFRPAVVLAVFVLAMAEVVNLAAGMRYVRAVGGYPGRTNGDHLGGWIYLATAVVIVVA